MHYHAPGTALATIKPKTVGLGIGLMSALITVPVGALVFGLVGLIFKRGGTGALVGASAGALYSVFTGLSASRMTRIIKSSPQFQNKMPEIDFSTSGTSAEGGITFDGMARSIAPL